MVASFRFQMLLQCFGNAAPVLQAKSIPRMIRDCSEFDSAFHCAMLAKKLTKFHVMNVTVTRFSVELLTMNDKDNSVTTHREMTHKSEL